MLVFKRKRLRPELEDGAPTNTIFTCTDSGWMDSEAFLMWMKHFIKHVQPSKESKCLLLLDGHSSHTKNLEAINLARECGVVMLSFPPHTTHRMQPLDVGFFKPLKTAYNRSVETWMKSHSYKRAVSAYQVSRFVGEAYLKAATMETAINGFRATGLWLPNH